MTEARKTKRRALTWVKLPLATFDSHILLGNDIGAIYPWLLIEMCKSGEPDGGIGRAAISPLLISKALGITVEIARDQIDSAFKCGLLDVNKNGLIVMHGFDPTTPDPTIPIPLEEGDGDAIGINVAKVVEQATKARKGSRYAPRRSYSSLTRGHARAFPELELEQGSLRDLAREGKSPSPGAPVLLNGGDPLTASTPTGDDPLIATDYTSKMIPGDGGDLGAPTRDIDGKVHYTVFRLRQMLMSRWPNDNYQCRSIYEFCREVSAEYPKWAIDAAMAMPLKGIRRPYGIRSVLGGVARAGRPRQPSESFQAELVRDQLAQLRADPEGMDELIADCMATGERPEFAEVREAMRERLEARKLPIPALFTR